MSKTRLFVGNLAPDARREDLDDLFSKYGRIVSSVVMRNFGYVEFEDERDADDAMTKLQGYRVLGRELNIEFAKPRRRDDGYSRERRYDDRRDYGRRDAYSDRRDDRYGGDRYGGDRYGGRRDYDDRRREPDRRRDYDRRDDRDDRRSAPAAAEERRPEEKRDERRSRSRSPKRSADAASPVAATASRRRDSPIAHDEEY